MACAYPDRTGPPGQQHLLAGDYGWDTCGPGLELQPWLERQSRNLAGCGEAEVMQARWSMLRTLECLPLEALHQWAGVHFAEVSAWPELVS